MKIYKITDPYDYEAVYAIFDTISYARQYVEFKQSQGEEFTIEICDITIEELQNQVQEESRMVVYKAVDVYDAVYAIFDTEYEARRYIKFQQAAGTLLAIREELIDEEIFNKLFS